jgi:hypothetical protein
MRDLAIRREFIVQAANQRQYNWMLPAVGLFILAAFGGVYLVNREIYLRLIDLWSFEPFRYPFLDTEYVTGLVSCWRKGIDVYVTNPCDAIGRLNDYSPLWLRMSFLAGDRKWATALGLAQDCLFVLSLGLLPPMRGRLTAILLLLAIISPATVFALERGNIDLLMFVMVIGGSVCLERSFPVRACGYAAFLCAALLKFYPLIMMARLIEETPRRLIVVAIPPAFLLAAAIALFLPEIQNALANVPRPSDFGDGFGSVQLGSGLADLLRHPGLAMPIRFVLCAAASLLAARLAMSTTFADATNTLNRRETTCLITGALLTCGCFLANANSGYRAIVLLPALSGVCAAARNALVGAVRGLFSSVAVAMVCAMWALIPMRVLGPHGPIVASAGPLPFFTAWLVRETLWWLVFTVLLAVLMREVTCSPLGQLAFKLRPACPIAPRL